MKSLPRPQYTTTRKSPDHHPDEPARRHHIHPTTKQGARPPPKKPQKKISSHWPPTHPTTPAPYRREQMKPPSRTRTFAKAVGEDLFKRIYSSIIVTRQRRKPRPPSLSRPPTRDRFYGFNTCTATINPSYPTITHEIVAEYLHELELLTHITCIQISTCRKYTSICFKDRHTIETFCKPEHYIFTEPITVTPDYQKKIRISIENIYQ